MIRFRCHFLSWIHLGLFRWRLGITVYWKTDYNGLMQFCVLHIMGDIGTICKQSGAHNFGTLLYWCLLSSIIWMRWSVTYNASKYLIRIFPLSLGTYISETSHKSMRRILGTFPGLGFTVGKLLAYVIALIFYDWRDSALALSLVPLLASTTMLLFPETPYWLASVGKLQDSRYGYNTFQ